MTSFKNMLIALIILVICLFCGSYLSANIPAIKELNPNLSNEYVQELDNAFSKASSEYGIDKNLLISMAFLESSFESGVKGDGDKSWGIMQVGKQGRKRCGYIDTVEGQIMSGACWLNEGVIWCGDIEGALKAYACGQCETTNYRCTQAVKRRLKLAKEISK